MPVTPALKLDNRPAHSRCRARGRYYKVGGGGGGGGGGADFSSHMSAIKL